MDVETVLLCDVLPDGTVAGQALVEPVYDTSSGERIGTRTVDPVTGDPYTPAGTLTACGASDGCTATTSVLVLCDTATDGTATQFVRATTYDCEGALLATLDRTLDGAAYAPAGTVGVCPASPDCESPATPTATVGLCLADGTPIAVTVVRDCAGAVTSEGWINLTSGAYSAGAPPAGTTACGESRSIAVSGTFCDVDDAGDVVGLVLIEYSYADDGTIDAVRLVDAVTGDTYTPTGTVTTCPAGVEQPERDIVQLCDTALDGTVTPFVRDYGRDENGAITGHTDYDVDGAPYTPAGTVGRCCTPLTLGEVCYLPAEPATLDIGTADDGTWEAAVVLTVEPADDPRTLAYTPAPNPAGDVNNAGTGPVTGAPRVGLRTALAGNGSGWAYLRHTFHTAGAVTQVEFAARADDRPHRVWIDGTLLGDYSATPGSPDINDPTSIGWQPTLTVPLSLPAGTHTVYLEWDNNTVADEWGALDARLTLEVAARAQSVRDCDGTVQLLDTATGEPVPDTAEIVPCTSSGTPCRSSSTLPLCDSSPADFGALVAATATDPTPYFQTGDGVTKRIVLADPQPLFDGGTLVVAGPAGGEPTPEPVHRYAAALLSLPADACPPCGDWPDTMTLTVAAKATNNGPSAGNAVCGRYTLFNGATILGENEIRNTPVGGFSDFTVTADVSYADLVAGTIAIKMDLETRHIGQKSWTVSDFTITLDAVQTGCGTAFLRTIRRDCVTGDLVDVLDTDYDGQPYTPVGEVASCTAHSTCGSSSGGGGGTSDCEQCSPLVLCDAVPGAAPVPFLRTICLNCIGGVVGVMDTELDAVTAYEVTGTVVDCAAAGDCPSSYSTECWEVVAAKASYDNTQGSPCGSVTPNMDQCAGTWRLNSWIVDGVELVTGTPPTFTATGCGGAADQLHGAWAATLATLDPDAGWAAAYNGQCLFFIQAATADPDTVYGQMLLERTAGGTPTAYTLGSAQTRQSTSYTKRFTQECDGSTTVTWLDADGEEVDEPEGELRSCGGTSPTDPTDPDDGRAVDTGVRAVTGTAVQDLVAEFTDVQSVSLTVLAGAVAVTMTDGTAVPIPAGVAMTWSVAQTADTALSAASFAGTDAAADYLLNWTHLS
ncbi:hypothetical protein [Streptomyces olivaceus]|uniref:hypothetical protein n=1 Tax=Streptomyces olivaceus TaxID=47716 RepID=UPI003636633D